MWPDGEEVVKSLNMGDMNVLLKLNGAFHWRSHLMNEWISIKERLPNVSDWVLVYTCVKGHPFVEIAMLDILYGFVLDGRRGFANNATHWMPLPEPPK